MGSILVYICILPSDFHNRVSTLYILKTLLEGLPWLFIGKESAFQCRGHGFQPWLGNWDPIRWAATEPMGCNYWASATSTGSVRLPPPRRKHAWAETKTWHSQINDFLSEAKGLPSRPVVKISRFCSLQRVQVWSLVGDVPHATPCSLNGKKKDSWYSI